MIIWSWFYVLSLAAVIGYALGIEIVKDVYVNIGSTLILHCICESGHKTTWVGPRKDTTFSKKGEKYFHTPYTDGCGLNPFLKGTNINVICNNATRRYNLEVTNFSRADEGSYKCESTDFTFRIFNVFVKIPPKVDVAYTLTNGTLNFECSPSGVPNNYKFTQLEHRSEFNEHIRFLNFSNDGSVIRTSITDAGLQDTGIYICNVSNDVSDQNGRQFHWEKTLVDLEDKFVFSDCSSLSMKIDVHPKENNSYRWISNYRVNNGIGKKTIIDYKHAPVFLDGDIIRYGKFGEVVGISAVVYNRHNVTKTEIQSITTIQSKGHIFKLKINIFYVKVRKIFYGSNVTLNASQVFFQLNLMARKDFTTYFLKLCNLFGCRDIKIDIRINTSKIPGNADSQHRHISVFAAVSVLSVLGIGMTVAFLIRKRVKDEGKRKISRIEDADEDTPRQSVAKEFYQSAEFLNSDNPQHLLKATESGGYVYYATVSTSLNKKNSNNQAIKQASARNYEIKTSNTIKEGKQISIETVE